MSKITNFLMDTSFMGQGAETRGFVVKGKPESKFIVIAIQDGTLNYYNFESNLFELGHTPKSNLKVNMSNSSTYRGSIDFPSGGGTYVVKLVVEKGTVVRNGKTTISKTIEKQGSTTTITFKPATANTSNYSTFPTLASTGTVGASANIQGSFLVNNASTDAGGFGLKINTANIGPFKLDPVVGFRAVIDKKVFDSYWYTQSTKDIVVNLAGDEQDTKSVTAVNANGISVGMELFYHKASTAPVNAAGDALVSVSIASIVQGLGEVTINFNQPVAFENGETMTLRAYGSKNIYLNTGVTIEHVDCQISAPTLSKTVRADSDGDLTPSTTITLVDTHGLSGGNTITYTGLDVDNSTGNNVSVVTPDCPDASDSNNLDNDGAITVQLAQTLRKGTLLSFKGVYNQFTMAFNAKTNKHPESNTDILFDLDKIITVGISGS